MLKKTLRLLFLVFLVIGTIWILRDKQAPYQHNEGSIFGTTYHIQYQSPTNYQPSIEQEMQRVDAALSLFNPESWLSKYNAGETPAANEMAKHVIGQAMRISKETEGAFDITVAPLVNAWGFGYKSGQWPTDAQVDSLMQTVGYQRYLRGEKVMLDCGAIAKGYAVDRVAHFLRSKGIENYMVEIGGEVVVGGHNADGTDWNIGIARPGEPRDVLQDVVALTNVALATSGNYRNYHTDSLGHRVAHTIDPRLGRPVQHSLLSATVKAPSCAEADAYATAFMVMGHEAAMKFLAEHTELQAYLTYAEGDSMKVYNTLTK